MEAFWLHSKQDVVFTLFSFAEGGNTRAMTAHVWLDGVQMFQRKLYSLYIAPFTCVCIATHCALSKEIRVPPIDDSVQYRANALHPRCSTSQPWVTFVFSLGQKIIVQAPPYSVVICIATPHCYQWWWWWSDTLWMKVMTALIILFYLQHAVEISVQSHIYIYIYILIYNRHQ